MDKTPNSPTPATAGIPSFFDAKRMSFGTQDAVFDYRNSPPTSSFLGMGTPFKFEGDPLSKMALATRRESLKGMAQFSDFSTD